MIMYIKYVFILVVTVIAEVFHLEQKVIYSNQRVLGIVLPVVVIPLRHAVLNIGTFSMFLRSFYVNVYRNDFYR